MMIQSLLFTALAVATLPQEGDPIAREYDVTALNVLGTVDELRFRASEAFSYSEGPMTPSPFSGDGLLFRERTDFVQLLYDLFEDEIDGAREEIYMVDDSGAQGRLLRLVASEETHVDFARALAQLSTAVNSGARVTLQVMPNAPESARELLTRGVATADELAALRRETQPEAYTCFVPRNSYGMQRSASSREVIAGFEVEIASGSFVHDPIRMVVSEGVDILAAARSVEGGHWVGLGLQRLFDLSAPNTRELALPGRLGTEQGGVSDIESPMVVDESEVSCHAFAFDAFVPAGQALVFGADEAGLGGEGGITVYTLQVTRVGSVQPVVTLNSKSRRLTLVDAGAAALPGWQGGLGFSPFGAGRVEDWWDEEHLSRRGISYEALEGTDSDSIDSWLVVYGDPEQDAEAAEQMGRIQAVLNERVRRAGRGRQAAYLAETDQGHRVACWMPMSPGWLGTAVVGRFGLQQVLEEVEVATTSSATVLIPRRTGVGLAISARTSPVGNLDATSLTAYARLGASTRVRGLLTPSTNESELLAGAETRFRGTDVRERETDVAQTTAPPIAGSPGGPGPMIRMRLLP